MLTLSDPGKQTLDGGEVLAPIRGHLSSAGQEHNSRNNSRGYFDASPLADLGIAETAGARLERVVRERPRRPACPHPRARALPSATTESCTRSAMRSRSPE